MLKPLLFGSLALLLGTVVGAVLWFHARVPPGCRDPATLALVQQSLTGHYGLPATTRLDTIQTVAGGFVAMRFVCQAILTGFDPKDLPQGRSVPGMVRYVSRLTPDRSRHEVSVELEPLLMWEKVQ